MSDPSSAGAKSGLKKEVKLRSMIVAPKDHVLIQWDLNQAESWCVAYFALERTMIDLLQRNRFHEHSAAAIYNITEEEAHVDKKKRYMGKQSNHMLAYRATHIRFVQTVAKNSDGKIILSNLEGKRITDIWHGLYKIENWWNQIEADLNTFNRTLTTPYGRVRTFFAAWGKDLFKQATASMPQSTVADHTNGAIQDEVGIPGGVIELYNQLVLKRACRLINQSHDSAIAEVPRVIASEVAAQGKALMERPLVINREQFTIPVSVEVGERWGELEEVKV